MKQTELAKWILLDTNSIVSFCFNLTIRPCSHLVPRHWHQMESVCTLGRGAHTSAQVQGLDLSLYPGSGTMPKLCMGTGILHVFTLVPNEYCAWAPCLGTKCEQGLRL